MSTPTPITDASFLKHAPGHSTNSLFWLGGIAKDMKQLETSLAEANREKAQLAEQLAAERALGVRLRAAINKSRAYTTWDEQTPYKNWERADAELDAALAATPASAASELADVLSKAAAIAAAAPELNISNYDEDDVSALNHAMTELHNLLKRYANTSGEGHPEDRKPSDGRVANHA